MHKWTHIYSAALTHLTTPPFLPYHSSTTIIHFPLLSSPLPPLITLYSPSLSFSPISPIDSEAAADVPRSLELAAYFTHCNLQPAHLMLALKTAMALAFKNKVSLPCMGSTLSRSVVFCDVLFCSVLFCVSFIQFLSVCLLLYSFVYLRAHYLGTAHSYP